jgi:hypothetical protein
VEVAIGFSFGVSVVLATNPTIPSDFVLRGSWGTLPGDGFEQAEADDEAESGGEEDGPGVGGQVEVGANGGGRHSEVSLGDALLHTKKRVVDA